MVTSFADPNKEQVVTLCSLSHWERSTCLMIKRQPLVVCSIQFSKPTISYHLLSSLLMRMEIFAVQGKWSRLQSMSLKRCRKYRRKWPKLMLEMILTHLSLLMWDLIRLFPPNTTRILWRRRLTKSMISIVLAFNSQLKNVLQTRFYRQQQSYWMWRPNIAKKSNSDHPMILKIRIKTKTGIQAAAVRFKINLHKSSETVFSKNLMSS